jgi:hypothetical protein
MKKLLMIATALLCLSSMAAAQGFGSVSGTVRDSLNNPVSGAMVSLMTGGGGGGMHHHHMGNNYQTLSATDGSFAIQNVAVGNYEAMAMKMMVGHDADSITVTAGQNTIVNFILTTMGGYNGGGMHGDSLQIVNITGWAIVIADSLHNEYFLDNNGDNQADFRLLFGPDWYNPGNGAHRPANGDSIWVTGGLMGYSQPQPVVVYEINGLFWRQPGMGHGGYGGGGGCPNPDSLTLIEAAGGVITRDVMGMTMYYLDTNYDQTPEYMLNFGAPSYDPGNGAHRPNAGDTVDIVGGLMQCGMMGEVIIVYEINGQFWRDPGDTISLWLNPTSVDQPGTQQIPETYIIANSYPNPFNASTVISFELRQPGNVKVTVYDLLGRQIATLADGIYPAGNNDVVFDANKWGNGSSAYFYKIDAGSHSAVGKMILLK